VGLFRRKKDEGEAPQTRTLLGDELVGVPVKEAEVEVERMHAGIVDMYPGEFTEEERVTYQVAVLALVGDPSQPTATPTEVYALGQSMARMGYLAREYEVARFGPFEEVSPGLAELLDVRLAQEADAENSIAEICFGWAQSEPDEPAPDEASLLWMIPGVGGQMRNRLAFYAIYGATPEEGLPGGLSFHALRMLWRFGFLYCCTTEVLAKRGPNDTETREAAERLGWQPDDESDD
jgi:hypothetical protein